MRMGKGDAIRIEPRHPRYDGTGGHWPEVEALIGCTIVRIGTSPDLDVEGGGLVLEYRTPEGKLEMIVFAFTEIGMWTEPSPTHHQGNEDGN